jgi:hypothetical protein
MQDEGTGIDLPFCLVALLHRQPFLGFFYGSEQIVSILMSQEFAAWQAGLRPGDRIVEVNGQHW